MHTAIEAASLITGRKEAVDSILIHAGQVLLGGPYNSLTSYPAPEKPIVQQQGDEGSDGLSSSAKNQSALPSWTLRLAKSAKSIEQLHVIKEANLLVSLSDAQVSLHDLGAIQETGRGLTSTQQTAPLASATIVPDSATTHLIQSKGALSLALDTSIQRAPTLTDESKDEGWGAGYRHRAGKHTIGRAYRPSDITLGRGLNPSQSASLRGLDRPLSLLGMDDIRRNKEQQLRLNGIGNATGERLADEADGVMSVVTTLTIACRRKLIVFRWVDGAFWDTKEIVLPHTPRSLAFASPTTAFMGYSSAEFAILTLPLAAASSVADLLKSGVSAQSSTIPSTSVAGNRVDLYEWKVSAIAIPQKGMASDGQDDAVSSSSAQTGQVHSGTAAGTLPQSGSMATMAGAFSGLGGYIGMSAKSPPKVLAIEDSEVLVCRDSLGIFLNEDGRPTRREGVEWQSTPEEVVYVRPYILSLLPPAYKSTPAFPQLQIRSAGTLLNVQTLPFPPLQSNAAKAQLASVGGAPNVKLLTASPNGKPPIYVAVIPTERGALEKDGLSIWRLEMKSWGRQIDELVASGEFQEALALLHSVDEVILENKSERKVFIETLHAVSLFMADRFDEAIEHFIELDVNPARVIAMFPEYIAGPLATRRSQWFHLFGGQKIDTAKFEKDDGKPAVSKSSRPQPGPKAKDASDAESIRSQRSTPVMDLSKDRSRLASLWARRPVSMPQSDTATTPSGSPLKDGPLQSSVKAEDRQHDASSQDSGVSARQFSSVDEEESNSNAKAAGPVTESERKSVDALGRFLADRRRIFKPILETQPTSHGITLSQTRRDPQWLLEIPSEPLGNLTTEQLTAVAQVVDTALFKTFLTTKPGLLGPLCRVENWCEVEQVEELLMARQRYTELISLYGGKEMHGKALQLLRKMSETVDDIDEKVGPTIRYLQNLGPEHIDAILDAAHWVLSLDPDLGMEIFCADTGKVASLPRHAIVSDLEKFNEELCIRYLDHLITVHDESDPYLHEKMAFLLLRRANMPAISTESKTAAIGRLQALLETSQQYRAERVLHQVSTQDAAFYDVRALLLGRLGQDEAALRIYVDRLGNHAKAEEYCKAIRAKKPDSRVFLTLLQIYLRPRGKREDTGKDSVVTSHERASIQLTPALSIIARYSSHMDANAVLELLPHDIALTSVAAFATRTLQQTHARRAQSVMVAHVAQERASQVNEQQIRLHRRRVRVTEGRTCPRCLKRLGNSVIAVTPQGAVLHYGCSRHETS